MAKKRVFKSEESKARQMATRFGQPNGNKPCPPQIAVNQRDFYRWCEAKATAQELRDYVNDETKPEARRKFLQALLSAKKLSDFFDLTNQTHGLPKQQVEIDNTPISLNIVIEDDDNRDNTQGDERDN